MIKYIKIWMAITVLLSFVACTAQIKNATTESVKIYGNCEMCESTIEKAGNVKKVAKVDWNKDSKMATLTYNRNETNRDEILKRIALSGYDSDQFLAPDNVYDQLPDCCKYQRVKKTEITNTEIIEKDTVHKHEEIVEKKPEVNQLKTVFEQYFALKDALVKSDGTLAANKANELQKAINAVQVNQLSNEEQTVWAKLANDLKSDIGNIKATKDLSQQRLHFITLSDHMYPLFKVSKQDSPIYYQHCPMANNGKGANWLSKENGIKNPYYGSAMLTCGSTVETID